MPLPGVHESVTFVDHVKTNKGIFEIFSPSGSHTILVFLYQMGWRCSNGKLETPLTGASNARGLWETDDFRPISCSIWETVIVRWAHSARQSVSGTVLTDCLCSVVYLRYIVMYIWHLVVLCLCLGHEHLVYCQQLCPGLVRPCTTLLPCQYYGVSKLKIHNCCQIPLDNSINKHT